MQSTLVTLKESEDTALLTLYEAKLGLNMFTAGTEGLNDQIEMLIAWTSDEIAISCNRSFGKETVKETFREIRAASTFTTIMSIPIFNTFTGSRRLYLSKYPNITVDSVTENGVEIFEDVDFELNDDGGWLTRLGGKEWIEPVVVTYTGGYNLPKDAPGSLKKAAILVTREAYYAAARGDASVKLVVHKESRVGFFDPRLIPGAGTGGGGGTTPAMRAVGDLLQAYTRDLGVM